MTREEAIQLAKSGWWKRRTPREIAVFQLHEDKLCMDFGDFHQAIETALGRSVFTHEFGMDREGLEAELDATGSELDGIRALVAGKLTTPKG